MANHYNDERKKYNSQGNKNMEEINTVAGIASSKKEKTYEITTADVKSFIQKRFTRVDSALKSKGQIKEGEEIEVQVISIRPERNYVPFLLILPRNVLPNKKVSKRPAIFEVDHSNGIRIKEWYYPLIANLMFSSEDSHAFRSDVLKRELGFKNHSTGNMLHRFATPKIIGKNDSYDDDYSYDSSKVVVLLDPVRVFHEMLKDSSNLNQRFDICIKELDRLDEKNWKYTIKRMISKRSNDNEVESKILRELFRV